MFSFEASQKDAWRCLQGRTQRLPNGGIIKWRRPLPTDGALVGPTETHRLEVCGVPFGMRSWAPLEKNPSSHRGTPEDFMQRDLKRRPKLPLPGCRNGTRHSRPAKAYSIRWREDWNGTPHMALPGTPPLPSCPHSGSSSSTTARPEAHPLTRARSQPLVNGDAIYCAMAQSANPQASLPSLRAAEGETDTPPLVLAITSSLAAAPALEHATHQSSLAVYQSRRRYQSAPASPREFQNWRAKYEKHLQATVRDCPPEEFLETPGISALVSPGVQDTSLPEMIHMLEVSPAAGVYAPTPWDASLGTCAASVIPAVEGWSDAISRNGGPTSYVYRRLNSPVRTTVYCLTLYGRRGVASMRQCHGALRQSYAGVEGDLIRQDSKMARATCSCGTPPPAGRWDSICVASAYRPMVPTVRGELWEDSLQLCGAFPKLPVLIGGDFNVMLVAADRPNDTGGMDQGSTRFKEVLPQLGLGEMGPTERRFTWRGPTSQSWIDRFLYTPELLDVHALAEVTSLPRPLSDHTPLLWASQV